MSKLHTFKTYRHKAVSGGGTEPVEENWTLNNNLLLAIYGMSCIRNSNGYQTMKVEAIKYLRDQCGMGLWEAKNIVEMIWEQFSISLDGKVVYLPRNQIVYVSDWEPRE